MTYLLAIAAVFFFAKWLNALEREARLRREKHVLELANCMLAEQLEKSDKTVVTAAEMVRDAERRYDRRCVGMVVGDN